MVNNKWHIGNPAFECDAVCSDHKVWPWNGHRLFAYDLICYLRPQLVVELGTYWGTSFFSFCQAIKDENLSTECVAIDTWQGDEHTGPYDSEVFKSVSETLHTYYPGIKARLKRSLFSEAINDFQDGTIDLLHIDGFHEYDAVRQDFESWLPKLKENGVVLLHDIADECDYGSVKFWKELCGLHKTFTFQHSWGLGVVFPKGNKVYHQLLENNFQDKLLYYQNISEVQLLKIQKEDMEMWGEKQDALIKHQESVISDLKIKSNELQGQIEAIRSSVVYKALKRFGLFTR